jgi:hypothetical protein
MAKWMLRDERTGAVLSQHPNVGGAKLSSLFHATVGDHVVWKDSYGPVSVCAAQGFVGDELRFSVYLY